MVRALITERIIKMTVIVLLIRGVVVFAAESNADEKWEKYYEGNLATYFFDKKSVRHPYKDDQATVAVWTKNTPNAYTTHNRERIGYFIDLIYIDCENMKYRRTEMLIYNDSGQLMNRQVGIPTYYTIDPESEADALFKKVCT